MNSDLNIGSKIQDLRNQNGLTQKELADRTELTKGYISQLEHGQAIPSIMTLLDILECLGTNITEFFSEEPKKQIVFQEEDYFTKKYESQKATIDWLVPDAQKNQMEPIRVTLEPEGFMPDDKPHDGEEFGYVLSGDLYLILGEEKHHIKKGESFYYPAVKHHGVQAGKRGCKFLWICTPPNF